MAKTKVLQCPECAKRFVNKRSLAQHMLDAHGIEIDTTIAKTAQSINLSPKALEKLGLMDVPVDLLMENPENANFLIASLHPAHEVDLRVLGVPAGDSARSAILTHRLEWNITNPSATSAWDACIIIPPIDGVACVTAVGTAGTDFGNINSWSSAAHMPFPQRHDNDWTSRIPFASKLATSGRLIGKSITVALNAPAIANQGKVFAWQNHRPTEYEGTSTIDTNEYFTESVTLPMSEGAAAGLNPMIYKQAAKEGVYMPLHYNNNQHQMKPIRVPHWGRVAYRVFLDQGETQSIDLGTTQNCLSTYRDDLNWGVVVFRGIDQNATLTYKVIAREELVPQWDSVYGPLAHKTMPRDTPCLDTLLNVQQHMAVAYPESYNSFGDIMKSIGKGVSWVAKALTPALTAVNPALGAISGGVGTLLGDITK